MYKACVFFLKGLVECLACLDISCPGLVCQLLFACLLACLLAHCLLACLLACSLLACLLACVLACLFACLLACLLAACLLLACSAIHALRHVSFTCIYIAEHLVSLCCHSHAQAQLLVQANYQLVLPNIRDYLTDIGAAVSMAGVVIGCCDIASIPGTIGEAPPLHPSASLISLCVYLSSFT